MRQFLTLLCLVGTLARCTSAHAFQSETFFTTTTIHTARWCAECERDDSGRIRRSSTVRSAFQNPCPATGITTGPCPGYVVDHTRALCAGGRDVVSNLQWQTVGAAKEKDRWECSQPKQRPVPPPFPRT